MSSSALKRRDRLRKRANQCENTAHSPLIEEPPPTRRIRGRPKKAVSSEDDAREPTTIDDGSADNPINADRLTLPYARRYPAR